MSNNPEDFEKLRKLLKIKQHEQPPPGYFSNFSGLVINRIEREGGGEAAWAEAPWLRRLFRMFETSPVIGGLFGSALCALVILGLTLANQPDKVADGAWRPPGSLKNTADAGGSSLSPVLAPTADVAPRSTDAMFGSTNTDSSLAVNVEPVSFAKPAPH